MKKTPVKRPITATYNRHCLTQDVADQEGARLFMPTVTHPHQPHTTARRALFLLLACAAALLWQPPQAMAQASTIGRPFAGDAGSQFRYTNFVVSESRTLTGTLTNTSDRPRRDVVIVITAIGLESRAPVWNVTKRFSQISAGDSVSIDASYGRFTAPPGAFSFEITEASAPPPPPAPDPEEEETDDPGGIDDDEYPTTNACSSIRTVRGRYVLEGTGTCDTVGFPLDAGRVDFKITRRGSGAIVVDLLDNEKQQVATVANESSYFNTRGSVKILTDIRYRLKVVHDGKWVITISGKGIANLGQEKGGGNDSQRRPRREDRIKIILE